ncbi:MAG: gamma-D-glutamyl-meso-diaminopimelate peptidase [Ruminococcaceae bacterium]|nr:gamma-D-glutamyl-meso-diaminopimelate peptidase [Oscillospiraceae bacterium]
MENIITNALPLNETRNKQIAALCRRYSFISSFPIGKSVLGRPITVLRVGNSSQPVLYTGAFHAQEWLTAVLLLRFAEQLCIALDENRHIAEVDCRRAMLDHGLVIVPCVNPDGVELVLSGTDSAGILADEVRHISRGDLSDWNANARGVDLNRNYDAGWHISRQLEHSLGIDAPAPRRYGGSAPHSEPETQAMVRLCRQMNFRSVFAFHSQGEEIYWKYGEHTPARSALMAKVLAASCGYTAAQPEDIASHAGFKDWFIEKYRRPGFTIEVGKGTNPLPIEEVCTIYERIEEMMMLGVVI